MAELTDEMKEAIVTRLARYEPQTEVAKVVGEEFGITISKQQVNAYNPGIASFEGGQKWVYLFDEVRKRWREEIAEHAIADPAYRLGVLGRIVEKAERSGNMVLAMQALEQAAKDVGGVYTNRQMHHHVVDDRRARPVSELREELATRLKHVQETMPAIEGDIVSRSEERKES